MRPEDVERFKREGEALLGKDVKVNEEALSQLGAMHQQLIKSQRQETQQLVDAKAENEEQKQLLIDAQNQTQQLVDAAAARRGCSLYGCVLS